MLRKVKHLIPGLCCYLLLSLCVACTQSWPNIVEVPSREPSQPPVTTPSSAPTPSSTSEAPLHEWAGSGYSYTSENLGVAVEFPPDWADLMTISDDVTSEYFIEGQREPVDCIALKTLGGGNDPASTPNYIAYIYWRSADGQGPEADFGESVTLLEQDGNVCKCWMPMNTKIGLEDDIVRWNEYNIVEQGILNGEYAVELLD